METKLYINKNLISKEGLGAFYQITYVDDVRYCDVEREANANNWGFSQSDMGDLYIWDTEDPDCVDGDGTYVDYADIVKKCELAYRTKYYNMKQVCEFAEVAYSTYKNASRDNFRNLSEKKVMQLLNAMDNV